MSACRNTAAASKCYKRIRHAIFLPDRLDARGSIKTQARSRGIFSIPVYRLDLVVDGEFARPDLSTLGIEPADVAWDRAHLAIGISDARAIQEETTVNWNGRPVPFLPGTGDFAEGGTGIHADVGAAAATGCFTRGRRDRRAGS